MCHLLSDRMAQLNQSKMMARNWHFKCQDRGGLEADVNIKRLWSFNIFGSPRGCWKWLWGHISLLCHPSLHCINLGLSTLISRSTRREIFSILCMENSFSKNRSEKTISYPYPTPLLCWLLHRVAKQLHWNPCHHMEIMISLFSSCEMVLGTKLSQRNWRSNTS